MESGAGRSAAQDAPALAARTVTDLAGIDAIAADWQALERAASAELAYFQSFSWCRNWVACFAAGQGGPQPFIRTVWRGAELVALWPLMLSGSRLGVRKLHALGEPHSQYSAMLWAPGADTPEILGLLVEGLEAEADCDVAVFRPVPASSRLSRVLSRFERIAGYENRSSVLDLSVYHSSEDYTARLGKLQRRNRNRRRNHLARLGALDFAVIWPGHPDFAALVALGAEMKRRWLKETGRYSTGFSMPDHEAFLATLPGDEAARSGACLSVLRAGGRVVAIELGFIHHRHYYAYLGGFEWDLRALSPGKVQMDMTVGWLIDNGIAAYDLLANPADYKSSWSNRDVKLLGFAAPRTWKGRLYAGAWLPTIRPAIKRLHAAVPEVARRLLPFGQGLTCLILYV